MDFIIRPLTPADADAALALLADGSTFEKGRLSGTLFRGKPVGVCRSGRRQAGGMGPRGGADPLPAR